jgi:hypothetical protein
MSLPLLCIHAEELFHTVHLCIKRPTMGNQIIGKMPGAILTEILLLFNSSP